MSIVAISSAALVDWVTRNGGFFHPDSEIAHNNEKGTHVRVHSGRTIRSGTRIASCPMNVTLSVLNALDASPFACHGTKFPSLFLSKQSLAAIQYFFLMEQWTLGQMSWWAPYLACLPGPNDIDALLFQNAEDLKWVTGTNLSTAITALAEKWRSIYDNALDQLKRLAWENALNGSYTWQLFLWAATIFHSRSFTSEVLHDTPPADRARPIGNGEVQHEEMTNLFADGFPVLLPLLDLLNYKPFSKVEWQARFSFVGLQVLENFESGQEICNNYGPRDNETLLLGYGFAIPSNPFDHFTVALKATPGSPLADARTWHSPPKTEADLEYYIFNIDHPRSNIATFLESSLFSFDLMEGISILCANDRELQTMYSSKTSLMSYYLTQKQVENGRNLINTISQLDAECRRRVAVLESGNPMKFNPHLKPETQKQQYAQIYRDGQVSILNSAIKLCDYSLAWTRSTISPVRILERIRSLSEADPLVQSAVSKVEKLVSNRQSLLRRGELLDLEEVISMIPRSMIEAGREIVNVMFAAVDHHQTTQGSVQDSLKDKHILPDNEHQQMGFAVVLAILQVEFLKDADSLPPRLRSWFDSLTSWYPADDLNWCRPPPTSPGMVDYAFWLNLMSQSGRGAPELPQLGIKTQHEPSGVWHEEEKLCWGWNVAAEEGVYLSAEVNQGSALSGDERTVSPSYLLYIPGI